MSENHREIDLDSLPFPVLPARRSLTAAERQTGNMLAMIDRAITKTELDLVWYRKARQIELARLEAEQAASRKAANG